MAPVIFARHTSEPAEGPLAKAGDMLTLKGRIRRLTCNGRVAIIPTLCGEVWVPLTLDGQIPDPSVEITHIDEVPR